MGDDPVQNLSARGQAITRLSHKKLPSQRLPLGSLSACHLILQLSATPCKSAEIGLKIRRPLRPWGFAPLPAPTKIKSLTRIVLSKPERLKSFGGCFGGFWFHLRGQESLAADYRPRNRHCSTRLPGRLAAIRTSQMPEPSECFDRADSPSRLLFVLEIGEDLALCRPLAQGILNYVEMSLRVPTLTEAVAGERSCHYIRRL